MNSYFFKSLLLFLFVAIHGPLPAQTNKYITKKNAEGKAKRLFYRAIQYNRGGFFEKAIKDFETAIQIEPNFIDAHYQLAAAWFNRKVYEKAIVGLEQVLAIDANHKPQAHYYLGFIHQEKENYDKAVYHFEQFLGMESKSKSLKTKANTFLKNSQFAAKAVKSPVPFNPKPLSPSINTEFPEYLPSITAEGNTLIFTRRIRGDEDVFISQKEEGQWQTPAPLAHINTAENEGSQYISADGKLIVFVRCSDRQGFGSCDLYFSERKASTWTEPKNMGQPINTRAWESQPSLSPDGRTLYFASNRRGSLGGKDIWRSERKEDGTWSNPINLGKRINTPSDDEAPFFHPDGETLYFMSEGHLGMGGYDLFIARKGDNGRWRTPENLGYPINTKGNEGALFISLDGATAYFAKDNLPTEFEEKVRSRKQPDIYSFELPVAIRPTPVTYVKATVKDAATTEKLKNARIELVNLANGQTIASSTTDEKGSFLTCLPLGGNYGLSVEKENYLFHSENFQLTETANLENPFLLKIKLQAIPSDSTLIEEKESTPIILKNVFFASGSAELESTSLTELNRLKSLLGSNIHLKIQINGHTDNIGDEQDNLQLSEDRAKSVKDYLVSQGITATRISHKGFGEKQPIDTNDTAAGRKNNRRTEFVIID